MHKLWLAPADWKRIQESIPVICVDVLPIQSSTKSGRDLTAVGLIFRETPQGRRWCLIGGRLLYGESLTRAIRRQVREALGRHVKVDLQVDQQPLYIAQYSPSGRTPFALDPRQHAVGLTYAIKLEGKPMAGGEAIKFRWFETARLPGGRQLGFGQDAVIRTCLRALRISYAVRSRE
jgi:ADP-ribose pyrophosphatase YjhB (NUDIX family)